MCFFIFIVFVLDFFVQDESIYAEQATTERRRRPTRHCLAFNSSFCLSSAACISFISCMVWAYPLGPNMDLNCRPLSFSLPAGWCAAGSVAAAAGAGRRVPSAYCSYIVCPVITSVTMFPRIPNIAARPLFNSTFSLRVFFSRVKDVITEVTTTVVAIVLCCWKPCDFDETNEGNDLCKTSGWYTEKSLDTSWDIREFKVVGW